MINIIQKKGFAFVEGLAVTNLLTNDLNTYQAAVVQTIACLFTIVLKHIHLENELFQ